MYVVATDRFMSGWGQAPGRSLVAVECKTLEEVDFALAKMNDRPEMLRVRCNSHLPRLYVGDHLKVMRRGEGCDSWFPA